MKKLLPISICLLLLLNAFNLRGQIITQNISQPSDSYSIIKTSSGKQVNGLQLGIVDVKAELKKDSLETLLGRPFRFGKDFNVDIDVVKSATIITENDTTFYLYDIYAKEAQSINLIFDKLFYQSMQNFTYIVINKFTGQ